MQMPHLTYGSGAEAKIIPLSVDKKTNIGRCRTSEVCLTDNPKVSRNHCAIYYYPEGECYALSDLGSTNGTGLNGAKIASDVILSDGDVIEVGGERLTFVSGREGETQKALKMAAPVKGFNLGDLGSLDHTQSFRVPSEIGEEIKLEFAVPHEFAFKPGDIIGGNTVVRKFADSQVASIFIVNSPEVEGELALKMFKKGVSGEAAQEEFLDVVQTAAKMRQPGFARYIEAGVHDGLYCYYLMDFMESPNLSKRISRKAPFPEVECLEAVHSVAMSLEHAYSAHRMVHRNLKPSNVLYSKDETPLVSDYGLSVWVSKHIAGKVSIASPWYISPEQIAGRRIGWHSDLYSLGVILFHMLTGVLPFHSTVEEELLGMHLNAPFPQPLERNPNVRVLPDTVVMLQGMTAKDPAQRFTSWSSFLRALEALLEVHRNSTRKLTPFVPDRTADRLKAVQQAAEQTHARRKKLIFRK